MQTRFLNISQIIKLIPENFRYYNNNIKVEVKVSWGKRFSPIEFFKWFILAKDPFYFWQAYIVVKLDVKLAEIGDRCLVNYDLIHMYLSYVYEHILG